MLYSITITQENFLISLSSLCYQKNYFFTVIPTPHFLMWNFKINNPLTPHLGLSPDAFTKVHFFMSPYTLKNDTRSLWSY